MKLFINEFIKDYKKKSTYLYYLFIFALITFLSWINYYNITKYDMKFSQESFAISFLQVDFVLALIFALIMFVNNVTQEYSKGTAKFLYTRPKSRISILTSKIFLALFNYLFIIFTSSVVWAVVNKFIFLKDKLNFNTLFITKLSDRYFNQIFWEYLLNYSLSNLAIYVFFVSFVLLICMIFKTQVLSIVFVIIMMVGSNIISSLSMILINKFEYVKYLFVNIKYLSDYYFTAGGREYIKEAFKLNSQKLMIMALTYTFVFFVISYIIHSKRDITIE